MVLLKGLGIQMTFKDIHVRHFEVTYCHLNNTFIIHIRIER